MESSKYRKATELKTKIISFDELQEIVRERANDPELDLENMSWKNSKPLEILRKAEENLENNKNTNPNSIRNFGFLKPSAAETNNLNVNSNKTGAVASSDKMDIDETVCVNTLKDSAIVPKSVKSEDADADLWTTKYFPKSLKEIIGNQSNVSKIAEWLEDWHDVHILGNKKDGMVNFIFQKNLDNKKLNITL